MTTKKRIWRGFKLKRFLIHVLIFFVLALGADYLYTQADETFTIKNALKDLTISVIAVFLFTLWSDPAEKEKVEE